MISIVCVYNDKEILDNFLLKSLKNQSVDYELILVDNTENKFKSASEALNFGGNKVNGNYIMFVHQDIDLSSKTWLEKIEKYLNSIPNLGIAGVAGKINKGNILTKINHGITPKSAGNNQIYNFVKVQTLDECLVMIPKSVFESLKFDEETCDDWHLYAADYCLSIKDLDLNAYLIPMFLYHLSEGNSLSDKYYSTVEKLINKHSENNKWICTSMGDWDTTNIFTAPQLLYKKLKFKIKKLLIK
jgi:hypothetical protein